MTEPGEPIQPHGATAPAADATPVAEAAPAAEPVARRRRPRRRTVVLLVVGVLVVAVVGGLAWFFQPQPLLPEATAALASTPAATFSTSPPGSPTPRLESSRPPA